MLCIDTSWQWMVLLRNFIPRALKKVGGLAENSAQYEWLYESQALIGFRADVSSRNWDHECYKIQTRHRILLDSKCNAEGFLWLYVNVQNKKVTETGSLPSVGTIGFGSDSMIFSAAENIKGTGIRLYPPSESFAVPIENCDRRKTEPAQRISTWSLLYRGGLYSEGGGILSVKLSDKRWKKMS